jgi:hypothetical protein
MCKELIFITLYVPYFSDHISNRFAHTQKASTFGPLTLKRVAYYVGNKAFSHVLFAPEAFKFTTVALHDGVHVTKGAILYYSSAFPPRYQD